MSDDERGGDEEPPSALDTLSSTAQRFLDDPEVDRAADASDGAPDDPSGEESPQDDDPIRERPDARDRPSSRTS